MLREVISSDSRFKTTKERRDCKRDEKKNSSAIGRAGEVEKMSVCWSVVGQCKFGLRWSR
jgi:hypothetical protein